MPTLNPARWQAVNRILERLGRYPTSERSSRHAEACGTHPSLCAEVDKLSKHYDYDLVFDPRPEGFTDLELIGRGGMSIVFRAVDEANGRRVALKFLDPELIGTAEEHRFRKEHGFLLRLRSPSVPKVYGLRSTILGEPFLVMELIKGKPVNEHCDWHGLSLKERVEVFVDVSAAVGSLHSQGVIHRDLSPRNVLVDDEGRARIIDFGTARAIDPNDPQATHTMCVPRTPLYSSPEQIRDERPTFATDVYALGLILFELLSEGGSPYGLTGNESYTDVERAILTRPPARPSETRLNWAGKVDSKLLTKIDVIVLRCLAKVPEQRYRDATSLHLQLHNAVAGVELIGDSRLFFLTSGTVFRRALRRLFRFVTSPRILVALLVSAAIGAALLALFEELARPEFGPVFDVRVEGNTVTLLSEDGRQKTVSFPSKIYAAYPRDLDGDGRYECFVAPGQLTPDHGTLILLDSTGSKIDAGWPFILDLVDPYQADDRTGRYTAVDVAVFSLHGEQHVAAIFNEATYWRSVLVLLDAHGKLQRHIWHPGRMDHIRILDDQLILTARNNRLDGKEKAHVLFAIDPDNVTGEAPPYCGTAEPNRSFSWYYMLDPVMPDVGLSEPTSLPESNYVWASCGRRFYFDATGVTRALDDDHGECPEELTMRLLDLGQVGCSDTTGG